MVDDLAFNSQLDEYIILSFSLVILIILAIAALIANLSIVACTAQDHGL